MDGGKKSFSRPWSSILVPLYVYPSPGAWEPLFKAIKAHPNLYYTVVVNPASGPGHEVIPDGNYVREISKLNCHNNVWTVGYVSTSWTNRQLELALRDVGLYSGWAEDVARPGLHVKGIFLDETPALYSDKSARYLETLASTIRSTGNFGKKPLVKLVLKLTSHHGKFPGQTSSGLDTYFVLFLPLNLALTIS
ncbi:BgTH12-04119 [Blumeria graminis f. sp. triticale]|uniref:Uncharacterized protein n=4 Tax=Blumeria graminis TaxID=34373 RepID=A0A656KTU5_BLUGR|nr:hypothetical protein BGT96224_2874 [Blumeria graminis f. sp. tritici 96224]CAD6500014.1 BgTH12-04119 [Blumeria graminis f. sp. triticale]VCU40194.1 Bgt-2874 [Blumeria graminis f. sp. tritici]